MHRFALLALCLTSLSAHAWRTAVFPAEVRPRAAVYLDVARLPNDGSPVWIHGGDSIATAWDGNSSLRERLQIAETTELPRPGSFEDYSDNLPDPQVTWYAGPGIGLLERLDAWAARPWTIVSAALAGARLKPASGEDPLGLIINAPLRERARLVTFDLGANDVCQGMDAAADPAALRARFAELKAAYPANTIIIPWNVPDVIAVRDRIETELMALPESPGKQRLLNYCRASWDSQNCPGVRGNPAKARAILNGIRAAITDSFEKVFELDDIILNRPMLDSLADDCFHPGRAMHPLISEKLAGYLDQQYNASHAFRSAP